VENFQVTVKADTQRAEQDLQRLDKTADKATKDRKLKIELPSLGDVTRSFTHLDRDIRAAANNIQSFYKVAKQLPGVGDEIKRYESAVVGTAKTSNTLLRNNEVGEILTNSFKNASTMVGGLVNNLAKLGFALFGIKEIVGVLQAAFGGLFEQTIGREIKLRQTILKTQTTLASTSKVFKNGREITDPFEKIVSLTGAVRKNIDSIRERSIALAGVTSNDVIEVFGIVAAQISQVGGGLKEAEDLAINFAAALGTFGIPLYQARQEIGSILRGDITMDSYLAKSLGITNQDIAKAKSKAGGVVKFLEDRLAASVAGQKIAAQGFSGVVSNIQDLGELIGQRFGAQLLDPLLHGLANVFETLFKIREQLFSIADIAGGAIARSTAIFTEIGVRSGVSGGAAGGGTKALNDVKDAVQDVVVLAESAAQRAIGAIAQAITVLKPSVLTIADAFIRLGRVFVEIKIDTFEALARALANVIWAAQPVLAVFTTLFNLYSRFLDLPILKEFAKLAATMTLLKRTGLDFVTNLVIISNTIFRVVIPALGSVGSVIGVLLTGVAALALAIGRLTMAIGGLTAALAGLPTIGASVAKALLDVSKNLNNSGQQSVQASNNINTVAGGFKNLGETARMAGLNLVKSVGWMLLIQLTVTALVNAFGEFQKANENIAKQNRANIALDRLSSVYKNVGEEADYATKAARDFEKQLATAEYGRATERIEEIRKKLNDLQYEAKDGIQTWDEFLRMLDTESVWGDAQRREAGKLLEEQFRLRQYQIKYEASQKKENAEEQLRIESDKRINLEKEIKDIKLQQENDLFAKRQEIAQKEVDIFRTAGELRIFQLEQANKKLIEGEQGASRIALEALNDYLATRERGELDIEVGKKELAISVANMEKEIENYKLENAKTIAKIRKEAAQYEENVAKNIETIKRNGAEAQVAGGTEIKEGFRVGSTGRSTGPHLHISSPTGDARAVLNEAYTIIEAWQKLGVQTIELSNINMNVTRLAGAQLRDALRREQQAHGTRSRGGAIDIAVPSGTLVPRRTGTPYWGGGAAEGGGGWTAVSLETGNVFMHGLDKSTASRGATPAPIATKAPNFDEIGTPAVERYAAAIRGLTGAMERLRALQQALTEAKTAAAFDAITTAAFKPIELEQYTDQMYELIATQNLLTKGLYNAADPERSAIAAQYVAKELTAQRELSEIIEGINKQDKLSKEEKTKAIEKARVDQAKYVRSLQDEARVRVTLNGLTRSTELLKQLENDTLAMEKQSAQIKLRNRLLLEGVDASIVDREVKKLELQQQLDEVSKTLNDSLANEISLRDKIAQQVKIATPAEIKTLYKQLEERDAVIAQLKEQLKAVADKTTRAQKAIDTQPQEESADQSVKGLFNRWEKEFKSLREETASLVEGAQSTLADNIYRELSGEGVQVRRDAIQSQLSQLQQLQQQTVRGSQAWQEYGAQIDKLGDALNRVGSIGERVKGILTTLFQSVAQSFMKMAADMIAKWLLMKAIGLITGFLGPIFGGSKSSASIVKGIDIPIDQMPAGMKFAKGGVFTNSIVTSPTLFNQMGEAGPEAIMPLTKGPGGRLGVSAHGLGGGITVNVSVDATGSRVQGDDAQSAELGRLIGAAVHQEMLKQKRPGGLFAS
jgi:hypothetical protein